MVTYYSKHKEESKVYDILNREKINATKRIWNKKNKDKRNHSRNERRAEKGRQIETAMLRATGGRTILKNQKVKTIKADIQILKREITKLKEKLKKW